MSFPSLCLQYVQGHWGRVMFLWGKLLLEKVISIKMIVSQANRFLLMIQVGACYLQLDPKGLAWHTKNLLLDKSNIG